MATPPVTLDLSKSQPLPVTLDLSKSQPLANATIKAAPAPGTVRWFKEKFWNAVDSATQSLPAAGATAGALIGAAGGSIEPGGGTVAGGIGGAGIGGMAGEALKQIVRRNLGYEAPTTPEEARDAIVKEGAIQGGIEATTAGIGRLAQPLQGTALRQYTRALAPTTRANKVLTDKIAPTMMQRGVRGSLESIENQAAGRAADLRPDIDAAIAAIPDKDLDAFLAQYNVPAVAGGSKDEIAGALARRNAQKQIGSTAATIPGGVQGAPNRIVDQIGSQAGTIPSSVFGPKNAENIALREVPGPTGGAGKKILDDLESLRQGYIVNGKVADQQAVDAISGVQDVVKQFGNDIDARSLRKLRQIFDNPVAKKGGYAGADLSTSYALQAKEAAANSIRDILSAASPDVAALNKEMNFWLNVQRVTQESGLRRTGQEGGLLKVLAPLGTAASAGIGLSMTGQAAHSVEGAAVTALATAVGVASRTPTWRTTSAVFKSRLANSLATGDFGRTAGLLGRFGVAVQGYTPSTDTTGQTATQ